MCMWMWIAKLYTINFVISSIKFSNLGKNGDDNVELKEEVVIAENNNMSEEEE